MLNLEYFQCISIALCFNSLGENYMYLLLISALFNFGTKCASAYVDSTPVEMLWVAFVFLVLRVKIASLDSSRILVNRWFSDFGELG